MDFELIPIEELIDECIKASSNPYDEEKLEKLRSIIIKQFEVIKEYDYKTLKEKMESYDTPVDEYYYYLNLYQEYEKYAKNEDMINRIINREYKKLGHINNRRLKKQALIGGISTGVIAIALGAMLLSSNKNDDNYEGSRTYSTKTTQSKEYNYETEQNQKNTQKVIENNTQKPTERKTEVVTEQQGYSEAEQRTVVDLFKEMNDDTLNNDGSKEAKSRAKGFVVNTIDFIFFNSSINGITFNDLKDEFKQEVYQYLGNMDRVIMSFDPDYKESLGEKYNAIKEYAKEKLDTAKYIVINHLGEDRYNAIISKKNEIVDSIKEGFKKYGGKALKWLKDKYEDWKEN